MSCRKSLIKCPSPPFDFKRLPLMMTRNADRWRGRLAFSARSCASAREVQACRQKRRGSFAILIDVRCETASVHPIIFDFPIRFLPQLQVQILYPLHLNHCIFPRRRRRRRRQVQLNQRRNIQCGRKLKKELKLGRHCAD